jgi:hypothetical protein
MRWYQHDSSFPSAISENWECVECPSHYGGVFEGLEESAQKQLSRSIEGRIQLGYTC